MNPHEKYMRRCLFLAQKGLGNVAPNPMVGAVLVKDEQIVSEGYTSPFGGPHAEVNAISKITDSDLLKKCTLYVSLEPCSHFGKTPPCAHLIVDSKIPRVVIGAKDSYDEVNGNGIAFLKDHGIEVITGILENECREINRRFFTFHEKKRPFIFLKWAQSQDGFIDRERTNNQKEINWITSIETKSLVHKWRSEEMGILVGHKTIEKDNPQLDVRLVDGKNPIRIILDPDLKLNLAEWTHRDLAPTIIFNKKRTDHLGSLEHVRITNFTLDAILAELHTRKIQSVLVEGGAHTLNAFISANLWDEARVLTGSVIFEKGIQAPKINAPLKSKHTLGNDQLEIFLNH